MNNLTVGDLSLIKNEFGSVSMDKFSGYINEIKNGVLIDIGVYMGASSRLMIDKCLNHNNKVYGIDPIPGYNSDNPNYSYIKDDSVLVGREWSKGQVDLVFFDSVHAKEQVLCELYYWWDLIKVGGMAIFHDTSWEGYLHQQSHHGAGKPPGNSRKGYDTYGGVDWDTPDKAVEEFFNITLNTEERDVNDDNIITIYEDEFIMVETNYALLGMVFIRKKREIDYKTNLTNWDLVFTKRNILLSFFK
jgi:hypothetical protein